MKAFTCRKTSKGVIGASHKIERNDIFSKLRAIYRLNQRIMPCRSKNLTIKNCSKIEKFKKIKKGKTTEYRVTYLHLIESHCILLFSASLFKACRQGGLNGPVFCCCSLKNILV